MEFNDPSGNKIGQASIRYRSFAAVFGISGPSKLAILFRLTPNVERLCSMSAAAGGQNPQRTQPDQDTIGPELKAVVCVDTPHQAARKPAKADQLEQVICRNCDIRDFAGDCGPRH